MQIYRVTVHFYCDTEVTHILGDISLQLRVSQIGYDVSVCRLY